jgi:hypothetical protein
VNFEKINWMPVNNCYIIPEKGVDLIGGSREKARMPRSEERGGMAICALRLIT